MQLQFAHDAHKLLPLRKDALREGSVKHYGEAAVPDSCVVMEGIDKAEPARAGNFLGFELKRFGQGFEPVIRVFRVTEVNDFISVVRDGNKQLRKDGAFVGLQSLQL